MKVCIMCPPTHVPKCAQDIFKCVISSCFGGRFFPISIHYTLLTALILYNEAIKYSYCTLTIRKLSKQQQN